MHIVCRHCHNSIELLDTQMPDEVVCTSCGSNFTLVGGDSTRSYSGYRGRKIGRFELQDIVGRGSLAYVTDAGDKETSYYQVLKNMRHPQTGRQLEWTRIVDDYHASVRLTQMAEALFGKCREATAWAERMRKLLKKPNGPFRVLHAAAAMRDRRWMKAGARKDFQRAYNYLRTRTKHLQYAEYRRQGLPLGSGVTEAACKTVFTQRLKLSGMRWSAAGAQTILNLRVIHLSGTWDKVYEQVVKSYTDSPARTPEAATITCQRHAA